MRIKLGIVLAFLVLVEVLYLAEGQTRASRRQRRRNRCSRSLRRSGRVCGVDGTNYSNSYRACRRGVDVRCEGLCPTDEFNPVCGLDGITYNNPSTARCSNTDMACEGSCPCCVCSNKYNPVCGTNGITYPNECQAKCAKPTAVAVECTGACPCVKDLYPGCACDMNFKQPVCDTNGQTHENKACAACAKVTVMCNRKCPCYTPTHDCRNSLLGYQPKCGEDGNTYGNQCEADEAQVNVNCDGECPCTTNVGSDASCTAKCLMQRGNRVLQDSDHVCGGNGMPYEDECLATCNGQKILCRGKCPCKIYIGGSLRKDVACACQSDKNEVCTTHGITVDHACKAKCMGYDIASEGPCVIPRPFNVDPQSPVDAMHSAAGQQIPVHLSPITQRQFQPPTANSVPQTTDVHVQTQTHQQPGVQNQPIHTDPRHTSPVASNQQLVEQVLSQQTGTVDPVIEAQSLPAHLQTQSQVHSVDPITGELLPVEPSQSFAGVVSTGSVCSCPLDNRFPVCGMDELTYPSECRLICANINRQCNGTCPCVPSATPTQTAPQGPVPTECSPKCTAHINRVCGMGNKKTYDNKCLAECDGQWEVSMGRCPEVIPDKPPVGQPVEAFPGQPSVGHPVEPFPGQPSVGHPVEPFSGQSAVGHPVEPLPSIQPSMSQGIVVPPIDNIPMVVTPQTTVETTMDLSVPLAGHSVGVTEPTPNTPFCERCIGTNSDRITMCGTNGMMYSKCYTDCVDDPPVIACRDKCPCPAKTNIDASCVLNCSISRRTEQICGRDSTTYSRCEADCESRPKRIRRRCSGACPCKNRRQKRFQRSQRRQRRRRQ